VAGSLLAPLCPVVLRAVAWLTPRLGKRAALGSLHRAAPGWMEAYVAYLGSGGYELRVGPEAIRQLPQPTLVLGGRTTPCCRRQTHASSSATCRTASAWR
jgi:hypothetical protein